MAFTFRDQAFMGAVARQNLPIFEQFRDPLFGGSMQYQLSGVYSGPVLEVLRDSDDDVDEFDFAETSGRTAIETFVGAGDGFTRRIFDQSGNGYHAQQTTKANQSKCVDSGDVIEENGRLVTVFDGTNDWMELVGTGSILNALDGFTLFFAGRVPAANITNFPPMIGNLRGIGNFNVGSVGLFRDNRVASSAAGARNERLASGTGSAEGAQEAISATPPRHAFAGVFNVDAGVIKFFRDSALRATNSSWSPVVTSTDTLKLMVGTASGNADTGRILQGAVDTFLCYPRAMTDAEVIAIQRKLMI
jgi:hypothetical protein